jgi:hypothetical protein
VSLQSKTTPASQDSFQSQAPPASQGFFNQKQLLPLKSLFNQHQLYASYQVLVHLAMRFQRRRFSKIGQSETRIAYGGHVC